MSLRKAVLVNATQRNTDVVSLGTTDETDTPVNEAPQHEVQVDENATILDPDGSERQYWRDPVSGAQREIWRPGDGDGDYSVDYYDKGGVPATITGGRWRFYQSDPPGPISKRKNEPPKNVILDDKAAHAVITSNLERSYIVKHWSHDFAGAGNSVRSRRPHRGRPAIANPDADGDDRFRSIKIGKKGEKYYFTGEKEYAPVIYRVPPPPPPEPTAPATPETPSKPKQHNQHTPKELLVRNGAESSSQTRGKYRERVNSFLRRSPSPPWAKDRGKLYGGNWDTAQNAGNALQLVTGQGGSPDRRVGGIGYDVQEDESESMWVQQDEDDDEMGGYGRGGKRAASPGEEMRMPKRKKISQQMSFLDRLAAEQMDTTETAPAESDIGRDKVFAASGTDSGSYAAELEAKLAAAMVTIEKQGRALDRANEAFGSAESRLMELEKENEGLKEEIERLRASG